MRKLILLVMMMAMAITSQALNYDLARREALFLSDKMAYELGLTEGQLNAVYEINLDYFLSVGREDAYGIWWRQRNYEMQNVLTPIQYDNFVRLNYFYRPISWRDGRWRFSIYRRYNDRGYYYRARPGVYMTYRGGRHFGPDRPGGVRRGGPGPARGFRQGPGVRRDARGRVAPPPSNNLRGPAPRPNDNVRRNGPGPNTNRNFRGGNPAPPRQNQFRGNGQPPRQGTRTAPNGTRRMDTGTRRLAPSGKVTRNGMVQRVGGTTRTQVTVRQDPNQQRQTTTKNGNTKRQNAGNNNRRAPNRSGTPQRKDRR